MQPTRGRQSHPITGGSTGPTKRLSELSDGNHVQPEAIAENVFPDTFDVATIDRCRSTQVHTPDRVLAVCESVDLSAQCCSMLMDQNIILPHHY